MIVRTSELIKTPERLSLIGTLFLIDTSYIQLFIKTCIKQLHQTLYLIPASNLIFNSTSNFICNSHIKPCIEILHQTLYSPTPNLYSTPTSNLILNSINCSNHWARKTSELLTLRHVVFSLGLLSNSFSLHLWVCMYIRHHKLSGNSLFLLCSVC